MSDTPRVKPVLVEIVRNGVIAVTEEMKINLMRTAYNMIIKYARRGVVNQDLVDIIRMNVRIPERAMGDLRAQITAIKTGERRFLELVNRYGRGEVLGAIATIMDQSEKAARARTRAIPDG